MSKMTNDTQTSTEAKKGGTPNHVALYAKIAEHSDKIYDVLLQLLESRNENIKLGAAKTLLNKIVPDLKSVEVGGSLDENGKRRAIELFVNLGRGFVPSFVPVSSTSAGGAANLPETVQSTDLAQESPEDIHSNNGDSQAGTR